MKRIAILIVSILITSGCAVNVVKKPEIDAVKKVAIIDVNILRQVKSTEGGGGFTTGLSMLSALKKTPKNGSNLHANFSLGVANDSIEILSRSLGAVKGWKVIPPASYMNKKPFISFVNAVKNINEEKYSAVTKLAKINVLHATGMPEIFKPELYKKEMSVLARELDVDALVISSTNLTYTSSALSLGGSGLANTTANVTVYAYDKNGVRVVNTKDSKIVGETESTIMLVLTNIDLGEKTKAVYLESITDATNKIALRINKDMGK